MRRMRSYLCLPLTMSISRYAQLKSCVSSFPISISMRARNRKHSYQLMDLGVAIIRRETFYSALSLTEAVLHGFGFDQDHANRSVNAFKDHDLARFYDHRHLHNDEEKMVDLAVGAAKELEQMFKVDAEDLSDRLDDT